MITKLTAIVQSQFHIPVACLTVSAFTIAGLSIRAFFTIRNAIFRNYRSIFCFG